ncbi:MAG: T9SS type A sorting domain-containing protein [Flavobacteriales bacterium]
MKKSSALLFSLLLSFGVAAQTFSIVENDTLYISNVPLEQYTSYYIDVANTSSQGLSMAWERISVDLPEDWEYSLCDIGICYIGIPPGATVAEDILVDSVGFFGINLTPHSEGSGMIQIKVWDTSFSQNQILLTWYFSTGIVGSVEPEKQLEIAVFPNPVIHSLNLTNWSNEFVNYTLFTMSGDLVKAIATNNELIQMDVSSLNKGIYLLAVSSNKKTSYIKIIKQ